MKTDMSAYGVTELTAEERSATSEGLAGPGSNWRTFRARSGRLVYLWAFGFLHHKPQG